MTQPATRPALLVSTEEARRLLGGVHPATLGLSPLGAGRGQRWYVRAIEVALDRLAGLAPDAAPKGAAADEDADTELAALRERIARAPRRA